MTSTAKMHNVLLQLGPQQGNSTQELLLSLLDVRGKALAKHSLHAQEQCTMCFSSQRCPV